MLLRCVESNAVARPVVPNRCRSAAMHNCQRPVCAAGTNLAVRAGVTACQRLLGIVQVLKGMMKHDDIRSHVHLKDRRLSIRTPSTRLVFVIM